MGTRISIPFKSTGVDIITLGGRTRLARGQRAEVSVNLPNTQVQELGSDKYVGRIFDVPEVSATYNAIDVGPRTAFAMAGLDFSAVASGTFIEAQEMQYVCIAQTFKAQSKDDRDIARTLYVPGARLESFSYNYSVGSDATEEYTFSATNRRWLRYDVGVASGVVSGGSITIPTARVLKNGSYVLSAFASGTGYLPSEAITGSTATTVSFDPEDVPDGTFVVVAYHVDASNEWDYTYEYDHVPPGYTPAPDQPVGVRGWGVEIYLIKSGVANNRIYRGQTCTIQGQYPNTRVQELGSEEVVGYTDGIPDITGTLEIMQFDFKLQELLSGDDAGTEEDFDPNELGSGDWGLLVKVFRRGVDRSVVGPEKTLWMPALDITQTTDSVQVGEDQRQSFQFASRDGTLYIAKGDIADPFAL